MLHPCTTRSLSTLFPRSSGWCVPQPCRQRVPETEPQKNNCSYNSCCPLIFIFQPKIIWLKNKIDIQGNPKYRALTHLGICSLEIRKPGPFDRGIYTCKAVNPLGEASVDCRVDVKGKGSARALGCKHLLSPQLEKSLAETQPPRGRAWFASSFRSPHHWHHRDVLEELL